VSTIINIDICKDDIHNLPYVASMPENTRHVSARTKTAPDVQHAEVPTKSPIKNTMIGLEKQLRLLRK